MAKHLNNTHLLPRGRWATVQSETALRIVATLLSVASAVLDRARSARCTTRSKRGATSPTVSGFRMECGFRVTAQTSGCLSKKARRSLRRSGGKDEHSTSTWSPDASELCVIPSDYTEPGMSVVAKSRSLTMSAVSSTVLSALLYALVEERHFALVVGLRVSNLGSL